MSKFTAVEGFISTTKAWPVAAPAGQGFDAAAHMHAFVKRSRGIEKAAKKLDVDPRVILGIIEGKRTKIPSYVLRKLGVKATVILAPIDATA